MPQKDIFSKFSQVKVLVVGDVMLDRYWWGNVDRISPEAPVPVVRLKSSECTAGGAANVAVNVAGLGATPYLVGLIGEDEEGKELKKALNEKGISAADLRALPGRPTTVKTRVVAHSHHVVRIDSEHTDELDPQQSDSVWKGIEGLIDQADVVVLSDYAKGILSEHLLPRLIEQSIARSKPVLVDPKGREYKKYKGATLLTPNRMEASHAAGLDADGVEGLSRVARKLLDEVGLESLIITQGEHGMTLYSKEKETVNFPALARKVYDVTGAGDTVIATLAVALGAGCDLPTAARLANIAAGLVVEEVGTTAIGLEQLRQAAEHSVL
jgi:D-beta-D-heptose 7-phosphate kinase/D-beta-D-heptose 1-phosphate adenosyltransferase